METQTDITTYCRKLPKVELHAHLNGSLSRSTILELKRYYADSGIADNVNAFSGEFELGAGDPRTLSDCFQVFGIAHALTTTTRALSLATFLTLKEFEDDGCVYIELRSTPRHTEYMTKAEYIECIVDIMQKYKKKHSMIPRFIVSINRNFTVAQAEEIATLAIEYRHKYPDVIVGIELSGNPTTGKFSNFVPALSRAREAGLKVSLHCGEVCNIQEITEMLNFKPDRIGHGICLHPKFGGTDDIWTRLRELKIPIEVCLTSNVNTKSVPDYQSHHFKYLQQDGIPTILCTDDKGVFVTTLSHEYMVCAEIFNLNSEQLAKLSLDACQFLFAEEERTSVENTILTLMKQEK